MNGASRLGLGTAQWGMTYGIANRSGRPAFAEVTEILRLAHEHGVMLLDTAHAYGEAEDGLGAHGAATRGFRIVTKTQPVRSSTISAEDVLKVTVAFARSLTSLHCQRVYGLLVHHSGALLAEGGQRLWDTLEAFKADGRVERVGVSVYDPGQLDRLLDRYPLDLVQLPLNIYNQRFKHSGLLTRLKQMQVEVHVRSVFLQGLLLMPPNQLPERFCALRPHHAKLHGWFREAGLTPLEGCLRFGLQQPGIDRIIVGCETAEQLKAILGASAATFATDVTNMQEFEVHDRSIVDSSTWVQ